MTITSDLMELSPAVEDDDTAVTDIVSEADLRSVLGEASEAIRNKALSRIDRHARRFLTLSPFFCIGSSRPDALADVSPRGGEPGFVHVLDDTHIAFPERPGNNKLDTLTNITHSPAVGLLFFVPGVDETLRINGLASITVRSDLMRRFEHSGKLPRAVVIVQAVEVYLHCAKALKRSELWNPDSRVPRSSLPTLGQIIKDQYSPPITATDIDGLLDDDAAKNLW